MEILLVGNAGNLFTEMYNSLSKYFKIKAVGFDNNQIVEQLLFHSIDCVLITLKEATREQLRIIELLKADVQWSNLKVMVIGFRHECNGLSNAMHIVANKILTYPVSKNEIVKELCTLCGKENPLEVEDIKGNISVGETKLKHVLVVDDDVRMLRAVKNWLQDNYKVSIVNSGTAAMAFLDKQVPDVILLDYEMPVYSGAQTLELIRKEERLRNIPVFFLTGVSDKETVKNVVMLNPQGYILKGITREELIRKLNEFFVADM